MISLARAWLSHPGFEILWHEQILFDLLSANVFKGEGEFITKLLQLKCDEQTQGPGNSTKTKRQKPWKHHWSCLEYTLGFDFSIWCHRFSDFEVNKRQRKGEKSWRQSENILFLWSKPSNYQEKLRCHAREQRTDGRKTGGGGKWKIVQCSGRPETAISFIGQDLCWHLFEKGARKTNDLKKNDQRPLRL